MFKLGSQIISLMGLNEKLLKFSENVGLKT